MRILKLKNNKQKEKENLWLPPALTWVFSYMAINWTGSWWYMLIFPAGFLPIIYNALKAREPEKISNVLNASGVNKKIGEAVIVPHKIWEQETETGYRMGLSVPIGLSSKEFQKREQVISETLGADVRFYYERPGQVTMEVNTEKLGIMYGYVPMQFDLPTTIPAGHSTTGFKSISFGEGISSLLVGAQSRAGKSSFLRQGITNTIITTDPKIIRLHLGDLKYGAEFGMFSDCFHVQSYAERITQISEMISWLRYEAERRFKLFRKVGVFKVNTYNEIADSPMPYHFLIIDELASLIREKDILHDMVELSRLSGAAGIYCIFSTQNPTVDVAPSHLKANCQARMAFRVSSGVNSMVILDRYGAEEITCQGRAILKTDDFYEVQVPFLNEAQCKKLIEPFKYKDKDLECKTTAKQVPEKEPTHKPEKHKGVISLADWQRFKDS